jgi:hypothetical protein
MVSEVFQTDNPIEREEPQQSSTPIETEVAEDPERMKMMKRIDDFLAAKQNQTS